MRHRLDGIIAAAGFASGDRVVVGHWVDGPLGPMSDVMWAAPGGARTLFAPDDPVAAFVTAVYDFDRIVIAPLEAEGDSRHVRVRIEGPPEVGVREVRMRAGPGWHVPPSRRPAALTRWVEAPLARALMDVRPYGTSARGVREWYQATQWRPVVGAQASIDGRDLGAVAPLRPACGFGFSEPPRRPSITTVRPLLEDPTGHLDQVLASARADPPPHL